MRFVRDNVEPDEEVFDDEDWQLEAQVARITCSSLEDGEMRKPADARDTLHSDSSLDNYQILAVKQADNSKNKRYTIDIQVGQVTGEAMIDSGSPISFLDFERHNTLYRWDRGYCDLSPARPMVQNTRTSTAMKSSGRGPSQRPSAAVHGSYQWPNATCFSPTHQSACC